MLLGFGVFIILLLFIVFLQTRIYKKKADPCGPVYVTIGDGGNREGLALT